MEKISEKDLKFLDFILIKLNELYPANYPITQFAKEYNEQFKINFAENELRLLVDSYKDIYIKTHGNFDRISINTKATQIIKNYGSLSKYLQALRQENKKATNKENWIRIIPIVVSVLTLMLSIILAILNVSKTKHIDKLENNIIKKDSVILELNNQIKDIDTLKIKAP